MMMMMMNIGDLVYVGYNVCQFLEAEGDANSDNHLTSE